MTKVALVAVGGNSLITHKDQPDVPHQWDAVRETCRHLADMVEAGWRLVITHGNGPQVGAILIQQEAGREQVPPMPLDVCGAQSQGQIGYMLQQSLGKMLARRSIERPVVTVVTQMVVSPHDPAFQNPTKPVGPFYTEDYARRRMQSVDETWIEDAGRGWRKVVASPDPIRIVERDAIISLVRSGAIVIANGGGGIPVIERNGHYEGIEAVIDKDLGGECLARDVRADILMILTDVGQVALNYRMPDQRNLDTVTLAEITRYQQEGHFKAGSMGPKVEACRRFVSRGGEASIIASLEHAVDAVEGSRGTRITR